MHDRRRICPRILTEGAEDRQPTAELEAWAKGQRLKNVEWFEDRETGKHLDRPAFQKMQALFSQAASTR